jgi:hypothetical protein
MESIIAQNEDVLVQPLDFSLGSAASYIVARESQTFFSSQNLVSPASIKIAKFQVGGNGFLDLSSLYFAGDLTNNSGTEALQPITAEAHCLFKRLIVRCGGTLVESCELHNVSEEFVRRLLPLEKRLNLAGMFLGADPATGSNGYDLACNSIPVGGTKRVLYRPMTSGLLNMKKYWPALLMGAQGLTFELELAPASEAVLGSGSQDYTLSNLRCLCDSVTLTSELTDQYTSLLLSGKSVFFNLDLHENTQHFLPGNSNKFSVSSARQFSRLNTLTLIMQQAPSAATETEQVHNFYLPASARDTVACNLVINGTRQPVFDTTGVQEHWMRFLRGTGVYANIGSSTSISFTGFGGSATGAGRCFAQVFDLEKMPGHAEHTGQSIDSGGICTIHVSGVGTQSSEYTDRLILMHSYSAMLELRDSGAVLYT